MQISDHDILADVYFKNIVTVLSHMFYFCQLFRSPYMTLIIIPILEVAIAVPSLVRLSLLQSKLRRSENHTFLKFS